ncbi:hypothetical protein P8605_00895 [Streptomyces sp. T-3]|nr:hypothetical protein [Streptomyces sp. T-3]
MPLLPWRTSPPDESSRNGHGAAPSGLFPGIPVQAGDDQPPMANGHWPWRTKYAERDRPPDANAVTRQLAGVMHARDDRLGQARDLIGRWQDRTLGRKERDVRQLSDIAGVKLTRWALDNVLNTRKRPVPSFGFSLAPVLTHGVAAQRQRRIRDLALATVITLVVVRHPWGTGALVVAALLYQFLIAAGALGSMLRWGLSSLVSAALLAAGTFIAWTQLRPHAATLKSAVQDSISAGVWLTLLVTAIYAVDGWIALMYVASLRASREEIAQRPRFAPRAAARIAECEAAERWQSTPYRKELGGVHRFVGAGLDVWPAGGPRIQLTPARRANEEEAEGSDAGAAEEVIPDGIRKFEADELLDKVRDELERLSGVLVETHALPNCDVFETLAMPHTRWKNLAREPAPPEKHLSGWPASPEKAESAPWPEVHEMIAEGRKAPSGHPSRRYLAAQVVDWDGQTVVTVFAHAALEGKTLHFVTRPHVLAPLRKEARAVPAKGWDLVRKIMLEPAQALGDTIALAHRLYGILIRALSSLVPGVLGRALRQRVALALDEVKKPDDAPVSLREHCAHVEPDDMHQAEDAARHISILQSRMFSTVSAFLDDHGVFTGDFRRQANDFVTKIFINGDHNQVNTGNMQGGQNQTTQADGAKAEG